MICRFAEMARRMVLRPEQLPRVPPDPESERDVVHRPRPFIDDFQESFAVFDALHAGELHNPRFQPRGVNRRPITFLQSDL
jgi:hypothetical protein